MEKLRVSENRRFLQTESGSPFFYLGDTGWELFHRLSLEEAEFYFKRRAEQGFNVIQAVALAEHDGLTEPNFYGRAPLKKNLNGQYDPTVPDTDNFKGPSYWDIVDKMIDIAEKFDLYIGFLPTWGDKFNKLWGKGPEIFNPENARIYGRWLGERYKNRKNIIWILGGDRPLTNYRHFRIIEAMAKGLREADEGNHLITFHPVGGYSSSYFLHEEEWLDFNMVQSGHGKRAMENYKFIEEDYNKLPVKPVIDGEPNYEDHPWGFKEENEYFDAVDVRRAAYWSVFSGACGHTYGNNCIWSMNTKISPYFPLKWKQALERPGAKQMKILKELLLNKPYFERIPDQSLLAENYPAAHHIVATRGQNYAFVYTPSGLPIKLVMGKIKGKKIKAEWMRPETGEIKEIGNYENSGIVEFIPPATGRGEDWVLILESEN